LYKNCLVHNKNCEYLEVSYTFDDADKEAILKNIERSDICVMTNFYIRGKLANNQFIESLKNYTQKPLIVITNTPYPISVPKKMDNLIVTYATSPHNIEVCAALLFGETSAEGVYPVAWKGNT
jgi:hypothetical protein